MSAKILFEKKTTLGNIMPVCFKRLTVEERNKAMRIIRDTCRVAPPNENVWTKENVLCLAKFVNLDDVFKFRGCFMNANIDTSIIIRAEEDSSNSTEGRRDFQLCVASFYHLNNFLQS